MYQITVGVEGMACEMQGERTEKVQNIGHLNL